MTGSRWEKPENPMLTLSRNAKKQLAIKPEGPHASHWRGTVVDLADFISRVSTARTGDGHRGTARAWRFVGARRDLCNLDRPADDENIPPNTGAVSAYAVQQMCGAGTESGDAAVENSGFPSGVEVDLCRVSRNCCGISHVEGAVFFEVSHESGVGTCPAQAA